MDIVIAYKYHYNGGKIVLPRDVIETYSHYLLDTTYNYSSLKGKDYEKMIIIKLVKSVMKDFKNIRIVLDDNIESLPNKTLLDSNVDDVSRGFILGEHDTNWKNLASLKIAKAIANFNLGKFENTKRTLGFENTSFLEKTA